jgi:hypothetical protein
MSSWRFQTSFRQLRFLLGLFVTLGLLDSAAFAACGGTERWFVKVGTDPDAGLVQLNQIVSNTVAGLNNLPKLQNTVPSGDNKFRLPEERVVYRVSGRLGRQREQRGANAQLRGPSPDVASVIRRAVTLRDMCAMGDAVHRRPDSPDTVSTVRCVVKVGLALCSCGRCIRIFSLPR